MNKIKLKLLFFYIQIDHALSSPNFRNILKINFYFEESQ